MKVKTILLPKWIIPIRPKGAVLENHGIAIDDGEIKAIFPLSELHQFEALETVALEGQAVMPGLVNAHTHASMNLLRCAGSDLSTIDWLTKAIWPAEAKLVSPGFVHDGALLGAAEMLESGTTTCHDMYFFAADAIKAMRSLGMRVVGGAFLIKYPTNQFKGEEECFEGIGKLRDEFKDDPLVTINVAPHAPYSVTGEYLKKCMEYAQDNDMSFQIHLAETQTEFDDCVRDFGQSPVKYLDGLGCVNKRTIAVHSVVLTDEDIDILAKRGASTVHCPTSNMRLGCGVSPVARLLDHGVNVALGTDGAASACSLSLLGEMRLAGILAKGTARDPTAMSNPDILDAATINGAKALMLEDKIGTVEPGKRADLISVDLTHLFTIPVLDVLSTLIYNIGRECISNVWVDGRHVVKKQHDLLKTPNKEWLLLKSNVNSWQNRVYEILQGGTA